MFRCPYCREKLVMLNKWRRYETLLEHGFDPNATPTEKPCYICPNGCHHGFYGIFGGYYGYDIQTGKPIYPFDNTLPPIGSSDWDSKYNSTWDISLSYATREVNKSFKEFMHYIDIIIDLSYIRIRTELNLIRIAKNHMVMNDCNLPLYKELWYWLKDKLGIGYNWR